MSKELSDVDAYLDEYGISFLIVFGYIGQIEKQLKGTLAIVPESIIILCFTFVYGGNFGSLYCFGHYRNGGLGLKEYQNKNCTTPTLCPEFSTNNCKDISSYYCHTLCINGKGAVYGFGNNKYGQLGVGDTTNKYVPCLLKALGKQKAIMVAVGREHSLILTENGNVWSSGSNNFGQLGLPTNSSISTPKIIDAIKDKVMHIACGGFHSMAITNGRDLMLWGWNKFGQCGVGKSAGDKIKVPTLVKLKSENIKENKLTPEYGDGGYTHTVIMTKNGLLFSMGRGGSGQLGTGSTSNEYTPKIIETLMETRIVKIGVGYSHNICITDSGGVYSFGGGGNGRLGHGTTGNESKPKKIKYFDDKNIKAVDCKAGFHHSGVLSEDGKLFLFGQGNHGELTKENGLKFDNTTPIQIKHFDEINIKTFALGDYVSHVIASK